MDRLTPAQTRGARAMLGWSMTDLAREARVSVSTIKRVEDGTGAAVSGPTAGQIRATLEAAGMVFLPDGADGPGMRMRPRETLGLTRFMS